MRQTRVLLISHMLYCVGHGERGRPVADLANEGLIFPDLSSNGGAVVKTGTFSGPIEITVETLDAPPEPLQDNESWEVTQEIGLVSAGDQVMVWELFGDGHGLPRLTTTPGQRYRLRVSARGYTAGMDLGDLTPDEVPVESHLVQLWRENN